MLKSLSVLAALLGACSMAHAGGDVILFGDVIIGKPLALEKCPDKYYMQQHPSCYVGNVAYKSVDYVFASGDRRPLYLNEAPAVELKDGIVTGMTMITNGLVGQESAYADLEKKFGRPTKKEIEDIKTIGGAEHKSINASWDVDDINVSFNGAVTTVASGIILIQTPELKAERISRAKSKEM